MGSKQGVVYTREWVVDLILGIVGYDPSLDLAAGTLIEPSCGEGAFLRRIVPRLCESARRHGGLEADRLAPCVRAYDTDERAVRISRDVVAQLLSAEGLSQDDARRLARSWIVMDDFLLADIPSARWVVGNPPYVRAAQIPEAQRRLYASVLSSMGMGTDIYVGFYQKALEALTADGVLSFICADRWLQNSYGRKLRAFVSGGFHIDSVVRMHAADAFEEAVASYPAITTLRRGGGDTFTYAECRPGFGEEEAAELLDCIRDADDCTGTSDGRHLRVSVLDSSVGDAPVALSTSDKVSIIADVSQRLPTLAQASVSVGIGVASGCDEVFLTEDHDVVEAERLLPIFFMRDWRAGRRRQRWLVNPWNSDGTLVDLAEYPRLRSYFTAHEERLRRRRVARMHPQDWYRTLDKPKFDLLGKPMLLLPDMASTCDPVLVDGGAYPHHNCYWVTSSQWDLQALGGLLMSDVVESFIDALGVKMNGGTRRFQAQYLRLVHIPLYSDVSEDVRRELSGAFAHNDRAAASSAARKAYGLS